MMSGFTLAKIRKLPWVSLGLFCLTYGMFGWLTGELFEDWQAWILANGEGLPWSIDTAIALRISQGIGAILVFLLMIILTIPLRILRILFGSWLHADARAFASVLGWAMAAVLIICWLNYFASFFVLVSAGMLCHLDLQLCGCSLWQVFFVLTILGLGSYALGVYWFSLWGVQFASWLQILAA